MAVVSNLRFCLMWETERPYLDRPRQSSYFRMFGEEWYLELFLGSGRAQVYRCSVNLIRRNGVKTLQTPVLANCFIIAGSLAFQNQDYCYNVMKSGDLVMECYPKVNDLAPSQRTSTWNIICNLCCSKPLSLQINKETIQLSTVKDDDSKPRSVDRCVQVSPEIPPDIDSLSSDISSLLEDEIFPDFELKCGDRIFPVHRSVLSARSEVFRAMFRSRMQENESGSADITDLEVAVLDLLLKFIYCGKLEQVSNDTIVDLYGAADKYAVHCLKMACSHWMKRNVTQENCVAFLDIADRHTDHDLRAAVVSFIIKHPGVMKSTAWMAYSSMHHELAKEVLQTYVSSIIQ